ncbi:hypothetical protein Tco_0910170 [Tanacetum coccineum]|uniref:Uncharacterized protein n=1 Tax=Tanacetum coccineum TaxID=301880 RepID=A0ABQ5CS45_9ASTR
MMKNYKSSRSGKALEAVLKVLIAGIRDVVLETISVDCLDPEDLEALNWYMFRTEGRFKASGSFGTSGSSIDRLLIFVTDLLSSDSELEFSHGAVICDCQIRVSVQWE